MSGLEGKVALVTGAGGMRGIGRATAVKLARRGARIALTDVYRAPGDLPPDEVEMGWKSIDSAGDHIISQGGECLSVYCDLKEPDQIQEMVNKVVDHFGCIDILVNNARAIIGRDRVPVTELDEEVWDHFLAINTTAVFLCTKFVAQHMIRRNEGGRIINIASDAGKRGTTNGAAYSASKFAVIGLTQSSALDLAPYDITVNAICPGPVDSGRLNYWEREEATKEGLSVEEFRSGVIQRAAEATPLGRIAKPEDVANQVAFLASEDANFVTGQAYNVNGGLLFH